MLLEKWGRRTARLYIISIVERLMYDQLSTDAHVEGTDKRCKCVDAYRKLNLLYLGAQSIRKHQRFTNVFNSA